MRKVFGCGAVFALAVAVSLSAAPRSQAADEKDRMIAHMVYFSLKDNSPKEKEKLVAACKKYLAGHDGEVFFAAGTLADEFKREVNDRDFDVALHIVFKDRAAHDKYQDHPRHKQFIEENRENWKKVRVFDSAVQK